MRICSMNVNLWPNFLVQKIGVDHRKEERLQEMIEFIQEQDFDVVFLQEIYQIGDFEIIKHQLPQYDMYTGEFSETLFWRWNMSGLCILSKEKLLLRKQYYFEQQASLDKFLRIHRSMLWAMTAKSKTVLCNVHMTPSCSVLLPSSLESHDQIIRSQFVELYKRLREYQTCQFKPKEWLVGGDFNVDHRSMLFQLQNPLLKNGKPEYTTLCTPSCNSQVPFAHEWDIPGECVDHIVTSFQIAQQFKPQIDLSDHYPIVVQVLPRVRSSTK